MPYAPGVADQSGQNLAVGISQAGAALGQGLEKFFERRKKEADDIAASRKIIKMIGGDEYDDAAIQHMSGQEARATRTALILKGDTDYQKMHTAQMKQAYEKGKMEMARAAAQTEQAPKFYGRLNELMAPQMTDDAGDTSLPGQAPAQAGMPLGHAMIAAAQDYPNMVNPQEMTAMLRQNALDASDMTTSSYTEPNTGAVFVQRGKQILPAGYKPREGESANSVAALHAPDGTLLGFNRTDRRGRETFIKAPSSGQLKQARDESGAPLKGWYVGPDGNPKDMRTTLQKLTSDEIAPEEAQKPGWLERTFPSVFGKKPEAKVSPPAATPKPAESLDFESELKLARDAMNAGTPREKVAAKFKERTGRDLP